MAYTGHFANRAELLKAMQDTHDQIVAGGGTDEEGWEVAKSFAMHHIGTHGWPPENLTNDDPTRGDVDPNGSSLMDDDTDVVDTIYNSDNVVLYGDNSMANSNSIESLMDTSPAPSSPDNVPATGDILSTDNTDLDDAITIYLEETRVEETVVETAPSRGEGSSDDATDASVAFASAEDVADIAVDVDVF